MANEAVYVALAILVIIITVMVWNRKVDTYSRMGGCQVQCQRKSGNDRNLCIQECLGHQIMRYGGQQCTKREDCQSDQVCVLGGFYTGENGSVFPDPNIGTCMDESDPGVIEWKRMLSHQRPHLPPHDRPDDGYTFPYDLSDVPDSLRGQGPAMTCAARCLSERGDPSICRDLCGIPSNPSACMRKCRSEKGTPEQCQGICNPAPPVDPSHPYRNVAGKALGTQKGDCLSRCMLEGGGDLSTCQNMCGLPNLKGPAVSCAVRCMSEGQYGGGGGYSLDTAKECRNLCGLPNPPSACMRRCKSEGGSGAECHGICDPPTQPDDNGDDPSYPTWAFTMSGEITPSKVENYGYQSCPPGQYWNAYAGKGRGGCAKIFSGKSSAWYVNHQKPDEATEVSIPGTTLAGYGVGKKDPKDIPSGVFISSDPGYSKKN